MTGGGKIRKGGKGEGREGKGEEGKGVEDRQRKGDKVKWRRKGRTERESEMEKWKKR